MSVSSILSLIADGAPPAWSPPMSLKHLDRVRSDVDGNIYTLLNNNPEETVITVGPGDPETAKTAWDIGWRKVGDTDRPGDIATIREIGSGPVFQSGVKTYLRTGSALEGTPEEYPGLASSEFSIFKNWKQSTITNPPAVTTALAIGTVEVIETGPFAGCCLALSGSTASHNDASSAWGSRDYGKVWGFARVLDGTDRYNRRMCSNGYDSFYIAATGGSTLLRVVVLPGSGYSLFLTSNHGVTLASFFSTGSLDYVGSTGEKPSTDCLVLNTSSGSFTSGTGINAIVISNDGGQTFYQPTLLAGSRTTIKPVITLSNKTGHVLILSANKSTTNAVVTAWSNNNYGMGDWPITFDTTVYYNVCAGCWDGEKYVVILQSTSSVDLFTGYIQPDGSVAFTKVSTVSLASFITGDGHKNSGNGIYYHNGQYLIRTINRLMIFPSLDNLCSGSPSYTAPVQGEAVINSPAFAILGDESISFNGPNPMISSMSFGFTAASKVAGDTVQALRIL